MFAENEAEDTYLYGLFCPWPWKENIPADKLPDWELFGAICCCSGVAAGNTVEYTFQGKQVGGTHADAARSTAAVARTMNSKLRAKIKARFARRQERRKVKKAGHFSWNLRESLGIYMNLQFFLDFWVLNYISWSL